MKFRLIWTGSTSDTEFRRAIDRYAERIRHFYPLEIVETTPEKSRQKKDRAAIMRAESTRLLAALPPHGAVIALDERGESMDSLKFSRWIERITVSNPHGASFVLGGDLGLDESVRQRADKVLSLSKMTLPHDLARVILLEQLYRSCTLIRNIRYHK